MGKENVQNVIVKAYGKTREFNFLVNNNRIILKLNLLISISKEGD